MSASSSINSSRSSNMNNFDFEHIHDADGNWEIVRKKDFVEKPAEFAKNTESVRNKELNARVANLQAELNNKATELNAVINISKGALKALASTNQASAKAEAVLIRQRNLAEQEKDRYQLQLTGTRLSEEALQDLLGSTNRQFKEQVKIFDSALAHLKGTNRELEARVKKLEPFSAMDKLNQCLKMALHTISVAKQHFEQWSKNIDRCWNFLRQYKNPDSIGFTWDILHNLQGRRTCPNKRNQSKLEISIKILIREREEASKLLEKFNKERTELHAAQQECNRNVQLNGQNLLLVSESELTNKINKIEDDFRILQQQQQIYQQRVTSAEHRLNMLVEYYKKFKGIAPEYTRNGLIESRLTKAYNSDRKLEASRAQNDGSHASLGIQKELSKT